MASLPPEVPATVEFVDIAGLIAGAHKGEGLGNKFLSHIREVDAICHVVRVFTDSGIIKEGSVDPKSDFEIIKTELELADFETVEKHKLKKNANVEELQLLAKKPFLVCLNVSEDQLKDAATLEAKYAQEFGISEDQVVAICARTEEQLAGFSEEDAQLIEIASPLHDVGKIGIPETVLHKPGKLTVEEFDIVKTHAVIGYEILKKSKIPMSNLFIIIYFRF